jgi:hypothetical protein
LIFEAVEFADDATKASAEKGVRKASALRAAAWCEYLESHATRVYSPTFDVATVAAKTLFDRIEAGDVDHGAAVRDIYNHQWSGLATREEAIAAIEVLEEHGWARRATVKPKGGGRPSEVIHIHPELRD